MKTVTLLLAILLAAGLNSSRAQNTWTQRADFGGGARYGAVGFSIGSKGYMGTGFSNYNYYKDFWEYDPATNAWTQKANFGGTGREFAVAFSIGGKGYVGTGDVGNYQFKNDFWEYDPITNAWTQKANFGGTERWLAVGFSIRNKGYIGTGIDVNSTNKKDFWEYDPATNAWMQKADFSGTARNRATGFGIGIKGYIGTGTNNPGVSAFNDFWEYDPAANAWVQKADFEGGARDQAIGFSIGSKGYIGTGDSAFYNSEKDFWEYDPATNAWNQKADFGGTARSDAFGFSIGNKGYLGTGYSYDGAYKKDFWEYNPDISSCSIPANLSVVNITSSSAKLNWNTVSGAIGYKLRYKIAGTPEWTITQSADNNKTLNGLDASTEYAWQVKSICEVLPIVPSDWSEKQFFTTDDLRLSESMDYETTVEVYPNPISQSATISFFLTEESPVVIELMDINGISMRIIADADFSEGNHDLTFNRESLSAGVYFLQMKTGEGVMMKKVIIE